MRVMTECTITAHTKENDLQMNYTRIKRETRNIELINSQKDHKRWTSFVYIGSKVYQLLLHYTSFATRDQNVLKKNWSQINWGSNC